MTSSALETKLYCPRSMHGHVPRRRLHRLLDESFSVPLTLVSAPPGYGKTVLASMWLREQAGGVAWLSLDREESHLAQFVLYLIEAIKPVTGSVFPETSALLSASEAPSPDHIARQLVTEMKVLARDIVVVLDDFHLIDHGSAVHDFLSRLLCHPPLNLHFIILTRRDPPFALARMRANNQLVDLRLEDLRFSAGETRELLNVSLGGGLGEKAVANVQRTLEGWGAGIRMATLATRQATDRDQFLETLDGCSQDVQEYLFEEVLDGLTSSELEYLFYSAIPRNFSAELLNAVVAELGGGEMFSSAEEFVGFLERCNMFVVPTGPLGDWYRYHNLFRELLLHRLARHTSVEKRERVVESVGGWLESRGRIGEAVRLRLEHNDIAGAAGIVERHRRSALDSDQWLVLQSWLQMFPLSSSGKWPELLLARASLAAFEMKFELLSDLVRQLECHCNNGRLTAVQEAELAFFRALPMFWAGDMQHARLLLEQSGVTPMPRGQIAGEAQLYLAAARAMTGDVDVALGGLEEAEAGNRGERNVFATRLAAARSYVHYFALQPVEALRGADRAVALGLDMGSSHACGWGYYMRALTLLNTGRFESARKAAREALQYTNYVEARLVIDCHVVQGLVACYRGERTLAMKVIDDLEALAINAKEKTGIDELVLSAVSRIRLLLGETEQLEETVAELSLAPVAGTRVFWLDEPAVTRARLQLASDTPSAARRALPQIRVMRKSAEKQHLVCSQGELCLLEAIGNLRLERQAEAQRYFRQAIVAAMPANWVGPFAEHSPDVAVLKEITGLDAEQVAFVDPVLAAVSSSGVHGTPGDREASIGENAPGLQANFTNRELDILGLLAARHRNKEIATRLYISTHTVNYHLRNIYQKLEVSGRRHAVNRALELGILPLAQP